MLSALAPGAPSASLRMLRRSLSRLSSPSGPSRTSMRSRSLLSLSRSPARSRRMQLWAEWLSQLWSRMYCDRLCRLNVRRARVSPRA